VVLQPAPPSPARHTAAGGGEGQIHTYTRPNNSVCMCVSKKALAVTDENSMRPLPLLLLFVILLQVPKACDCLSRQVNHSRLQSLAAVAPVVLVVVPGEQGVHCLLVPSV
jgi:hypothetical protein